MAHLAKSEDMRGESTLLELRRQYHCAAYNALIAVISCTQTEQKFYVGFLFSENEVKVRSDFVHLLSLIGIHILVDLKVCGLTCSHCLWDGGNINE